MTTRRFKLNSRIEELSASDYARTPSRRRINQLLGATLMPVCRSFAEESSRAVEGRAFLDQVPNPRIEATTHGVDNPSRGRIQSINDAAVAKGSILAMPVGAYGFDFGLTLWFATRQIVGDWRDFCRSNKGLVLADYGSEEYRAFAVSAFQDVPREIICEGIQSVGQGLSQLCSHVVPGYESRPDILLEAILQSGVINGYTNLLTFSDLARNCHQGMCVPIAPLRAGQSGLLQISPQLRMRLWLKRQADVIRWREQLNDNLVVHAQRGEAQKGAGCPARHGVIDMFTELVVRQALMVMRGQTLLSDKALRAMSKKGHKPFVIAGGQSSVGEPRRCPVHAGVA